MSVGRRVTASLGANSFAQAVTIASQLIMTPLFFRSWGATRYGEWLVLTSIPVYLAMADLGFGSSAANEMAQRAGAGDQKGAQSVFLGAQKMAVWAAIVAIAVGALASLAKLEWEIPTTAHISAREAAAVIFTLAGMVALGFFGGVISGGFRCCGRNALGIMLGNFGRLIEIAATAVALLLNTTPLELAVVMLTMRFILLLAQWFALRRVCEWLFAAGGKAEVGLFRRLIKPSLGFLMLPFGNALALQGPILIIGSVFGGAAVALYSTLRTLARVPIQLTTVLTYSTWPELSFASGARDLPLMRKIHRTGWAVAVGASAPIGLALYFAGPAIVRFWLGPTAPYDAILFATLLLMSLINVAWSSSAVVLAATNQISKMSLIFLAVNGFSIAGASLFAHMAGWSGMFTFFVGAEILMLLFVLPKALLITGDQLPNFLEGSVIGFLDLIKNINLLGLFSRK